MKERITVLLGAGAMIDLTEVSTKTLTQKIITECKKYKINKESQRSVVDVICEKFLSLYENEIKCMPNKSKDITSIISFEDIFHVLELIPNYKESNGYKGNVSTFNIFSEINDEFRNLDIGSVYSSIREIIECINNEIFKYDSTFNSRGQLFKRFFEEIANNKYVFDVFNLNYDTWVEQSLINYNDGYSNIEGYENVMKRFNIKEYLNISDKHTISHLHGQICFEYPNFKKEDINKYAFQESINVLYKYENFNLAKKVRENCIRSSDHTQSGENIFRTNIVTGLMKTDKLLWSPLNAYHNKFMNSLLNNKKLIIIGYGFSDLYINNLLYHYNDLHYNDRKILMIDYISDEQFTKHYEHIIQPSDKAVFTSLMFKDDWWYKKYLFNNNKDKIISEDYMACICTCGFKKTCDSYMNSIKEFLS